MNKNVNFVIKYINKMAASLRVKVYQNCTKDKTQPVYCMQCYPPTNCTTGFDCTTYFYSCN